MNFEPSVFLSARHRISVPSSSQGRLGLHQVLARQRRLALHGLRLLRSSPPRCRSSSSAPGSVRASAKPASGPSPSSSERAGTCPASNPAPARLRRSTYVPVSSVKASRSCCRGLASAALRRLHLRCLRAWPNLRAWKPSTAARHHLSRDPFSSLVVRCLV